MQRCLALQCLLQCSKACIYKTHKRPVSKCTAKLSCSLQGLPAPCLLCVCIGLLSYAGQHPGPSWVLSKGELDLGGQGWHRALAATVTPTVGSVCREGPASLQHICLAQAECVILSREPQNGTHHAYYALHFVLGLFY